MVIRIRKRGDASSGTLQRGGNQKKATHQSPEKAVDQPWVRISVPIVKKDDTGPESAQRKSLKAKSWLSRKKTEGVEARTQAQGDPQGGGASGLPGGHWSPTFSAHKG